MDEAPSPSRPLKLPLLWSDKKQRNTSLEKEESTISRNVWQGESSLLCCVLMSPIPQASVDMTFPAPGRCCRKHWTLALSEKPWGVSLHPMTGGAVATTCKGGPSVTHTPTHSTQDGHSLEHSYHLSRLRATNSFTFLPLLADLGVCKRN